MRDDDVEHRRDQRRRRHRESDATVCRLWRHRLGNRLADLLEFDVGEEFDLVEARLVLARVTAGRLVGRHSDVVQVGQNLLPAGKHEGEEDLVAGGSPGGRRRLVAAAGLRQRIGLSVDAEQGFGAERKVGIVEGFSVAETDDRVEHGAECLLRSQVTDRCHQVAIRLHQLVQQMLLRLLVPVGLECPGVIIRRANRMHADVPIHPTEKYIYDVRVELDLVPEVRTDPDGWSMVAQYGGEQVAGSKHWIVGRVDRPDGEAHDRLISPTPGQIQVDFRLQLSCLRASRYINHGQLWKTNNIRTL